MGMAEQESWRGGVRDASGDERATGRGGHGSHATEAGPRRPAHAGRAGREKLALERLDRAFREDSRDSSLLDGNFRTFRDFDANVRIRHLADLTANTAVRYY